MAGMAPDVARAEIFTLACRNSRTSASLAESGGSEVFPTSPGNPAGWPAIFSGFRRFKEVCEGTGLAPRIDTMSSSEASREYRRFRNRHEAGLALAGQLRQFAGRDDVVILGLPRGGIPVASTVAHALHAPLDVLVVRKLGVPGHAELAMGAIASGGVRVLNDDVVAWYRLSAAAVDAVARAEEVELERRERAYRGARPSVPIEGRVVILVDDGLATGSTMRAAVLAVRRLKPSRVVVAAPVGAPETCDALREIADDVVCALMPEALTAVGLWYDIFDQTTDDEVRQLLAASATDADVGRRS
jgi:putative phosphoribosyl transferase